MKNVQRKFLLCFCSIQIKIPPLSWGGKKKVLLSFWNVQIKIPLLSWGGKKKVLLSFWRIQIKIPPLSWGGIKEKSPPFFIRVICGSRDFCYFLVSGCMRIRAIFGNFFKKLAFSWTCIYLIFLESCRACSVFMKNEIQESQGYSGWLKFPKIKLCTYFWGW